MQIETLEIPEVKIVRPFKHKDARGFFIETYSRRMFSESDVDVEFVQDNHVLSIAAGTVRGLHFQTPPFAQHKIVRVVRGSIFDVAVDLRLGSPTYGRHVSAVISAAEGNQILVPIGFAHGLVTLEPETEVLYKVSSYYSPEHDKGLLWNDPDLGIDWPVSRESAVLSPKDRSQPRLAESLPFFHYAQAEAG